MKNTVYYVFRDGKCDLHLLFTHLTLASHELAFRARKLASTVYSSVGWSATPESQGRRLDSCKGADIVAFFACIVAL